MNTYPLLTKAMIVLSCTVLSQLTLAAVDSQVITIIASGETHAMVEPCDCSIEPGGGLAERATIIKMNSVADRRLLLDAGGFAGGGMYDSYTQGRSADSVRTMLSLGALSLMGYDAVAIGDDDLQFGAGWLKNQAEQLKVPLVSANCFLLNGEAVGQRYVVVKKGGIRWGITGLTTPERLLAVDSSCQVLPPVPSLQKIWKELQSKSDYQIILSHLGEDMLKGVADAFPDCAVIVNGHRKNSSDPVIKLGKLPVVQFGYQGKKLALASFAVPDSGKALRVAGSEWLTVTRGVVPDSAVARMLAIKGKVEIRPVYDLYIMGQCPYGFEALREFTAFVKQFPQIEWNIWFIGSLVGDSLVSLHGNGEVEDELAWLAVKALYPARWLEFLTLRGDATVATASILKMLNIDTIALNHYGRTQGRALLENHYRRSERLSIEASPTLLINNEQYKSVIDGRRLAKTECLRKGTASALCDSLPDCFEDQDCIKKGFIGQCSRSGSCSFKADAPFDFIALVADSTREHPEDPVLATTAELFPNATVHKIFMGSEKGQLLLKQFAPRALPFYFFGSGVANAYNFDRVKSGFGKMLQGFTFNKGITPVNFFPERPRKPNHVCLFIDPLFLRSTAVIDDVLSKASQKESVTVLPLIFSDPKDSAVSIEERVRREEALRWLVMDSLYRKKYLLYLKEYSRNPRSSYWFTSLHRTGIPLEKFVSTVERNQKKLIDHWDFLSFFGSKDPAIVLLDNCQLVTVRNMDAIKALIK